MPKAVLVVQSGPSHPSREAEYNDWYDHTHLKEVCDVPGFTGARRYKLSDAGLFPNDPSMPTYVAFYEMDHDDLNSVLQEMVTRTGDGRIRMTDAISMDPIPSMTLYEEMD